MNVSIMVTRSQEWIAQRRLESGDNVPEKIKVDVSPAQLSLEARKVLLEAGRGAYPERFDGGYDQDYQFSYWGNYGSGPLQVDSDNPSSDQLSAAILEADTNLTFLRENHRLGKIEEDRRHEEELQAKLEKEAKLAEARVLLASELALLEAYKTDCYTLSEFLHHIPNDALRGTLKAMAGSAGPMAAIQKKVESASPYQVFGEDEEE
jgi:hypothetical protein